MAAIPDRELGALGWRAELSSQMASAVGVGPALGMAAAVKQIFANCGQGAGVMPWRPIAAVDRGEVGRAAGRGDPGCPRESSRADLPGVTIAQRCSVGVAVVVEAVNGPPRNKQRLAGADLGRFSVDRPGQHARRGRRSSPRSRRGRALSALSRRPARRTQRPQLDPADCSPSTRNRIVTSHYLDCFRRACGHGCSSPRLWKPS